MGMNAYEILRSDVTKAAHGKYRRGGHQTLLLHFHDVERRFNELVGPDIINWHSFWSTMAFCHDALEEGLININDYTDAGIREVLDILTRREGETSQQHEDRKLSSSMPEIAAIVFADAMSNAQYTAEERKWTDEHHEPYPVARSKYLRRASRALCVYVNSLSDQYHIL